MWSFLGYTVPFADTRIPDNQVPSITQRYLHRTKSPWNRDSKERCYPYPWAPKTHGGRGAPGSCTILSDLSVGHNNPGACILAGLWIQGCYTGESELVTLYMHCLLQLHHFGHTYKWKFLDPRSNFMLQTTRLAEAPPSGLPIS